MSPREKNDSITYQESSSSTHVSKRSSIKSSKQSRNKKKPKKPSIQYNEHHPAYLLQRLMVYVSLMVLSVLGVANGLNTTSMHPSLWHTHVFEFIFYIFIGFRCQKSFRQWPTLPFSLLIHFFICSSGNTIKSMVRGVLPMWLSSLRPWLLSFCAFGVVKASSVVVEKNLVLQLPMTLSMGVYQFLTLLEITRMYGTLSYWQFVATCAADMFAGGTTMRLVLHALTTNIHPVDSVGVVVKKILPMLMFGGLMGTFFLLGAPYAGSGELIDYGKGVVLCSILFCNLKTFCDEKIMLMIQKVFFI